MHIYIEAISKDHNFASKNKCDCIFLLRHSNALIHFDEKTDSNQKMPEDKISF